MKVNFGKDTLGGGNKMQTEYKDYSRSTHNLTTSLKTSMSAGTLVPFMSLPTTPGDSWDIDLDADVLTLPTLGPLFGSYKVQLDVFYAPIELYQAQLYIDQLNVGLKMNTVKLPRMELTSNQPNGNYPISNQQINPSCIYSYLGIRGLGYATNEGAMFVKRHFNAVPLLMYWHIYKDYYANKQEEQGAVIHNNLEPILARLGTGKLYAQIPETPVDMQNTNPATVTAVYLNEESYIQFTVAPYEEFDISRLTIKVQDNMVPATSIFKDWVFNGANETLTGTGLARGVISQMMGYYQLDTNVEFTQDVEPRVHFFPLENIDKMREAILKQMDDSDGFLISRTSNNIEPYTLPMVYRESSTEGEPVLRSMLSTQEGLGLKTYQSDKFNNWVNTEWIDGDNGINEMTKVSTAGGGFTIDSLNLANKLYNVMNRVAMSGGSAYDWVDATYSHKSNRRINNPMYYGGLIKELVFQEVVSNSSANVDGDDQPLGTLAGRGRLSGKHKGGKVTIKADKHGYIMGIISLTPRIEYSQGNQWDVNLETMDDFHQPGLDQLGFQDLTTDQMAWFDTRVDNDTLTVAMNSAGKQPAWINYQTNIDRVLGNFAIETDSQFMVLDRRYEVEYASTTAIKDMTTYIDPVKFNHIFANTRRDAQNFWVQVVAKITVRRKMSARQIPNL